LYYYSKFNSIFALRLFYEAYKENFLALFMLSRSVFISFYTYVI